MISVPKKRYGIVLPEDTYLYWRLNAVQSGVSVGDWIVQQMEAKVEEPVKKAIDIERTRPVNGQLRKGLGPLPGEAPEKNSTFGDFRPAPKPGKKS